MSDKAPLQRSIGRFNQALAIKFGLDCADLVLLDWFVYFSRTGRMQRLDRPGPLGDVQEFYWLSYDYVLASLPILGAKSKRSLARRLSRLCDDHKDHGSILISQDDQTQKGRGTRMFYGFGPAFRELVFKDERAPDHRTSLSTGQQDHQTAASAGRPDHRTKLSTPYVDSSDSTKDSPPPSPALPDYVPEVVVDRLRGTDWQDAFAKLLAEHQSQPGLDAALNELAEVFGSGEKITNPVRYFGPILRRHLRRSAEAKAQGTAAGDKQEKRSQKREQDLRTVLADLAKVNGDSAVQEFKKDCQEKLADPNVSPLYSVNPDGSLVGTIPHLFAEWKAQHQTASAPV